MNKKSSIFVILRCLIGGLLIVSGAEKLISPYQNFLYVVQGYALLSPFLEEITARVIPWIELMTGVFLFLGLWLPTVLKLSLALFGSFMLVVGQALIRKLPLTECGCFGEFISLPPYAVLIMDSVIFIVLALLLKNIQKTNFLSLDGYFEGNP